MLKKTLVKVVIKTKIVSHLKPLAIVSLVVSALLFSQTTIHAAYTTGDPVNDELLDVAQAKLDAEYEVLIKGDKQALDIATTNLRGKAKEKVKDVTNIQLRRNKSLSDHKQKYTKSVSKLAVHKVDITGDNATLVARENVTLTLISGGEKEPVYTKEAKLHEFRFVKDGEKWVLSDDIELDGPRKAVAEEGLQPVTEQPFQFKDTKSNPSRNKFESDKANALSFLIKPAYAISGTYNASNAVTYASRYWGPNNSNWNTAYRSFGSDCTNFVSQALNWGGWQHVGGLYIDPHYWWYSPKPVNAWGGEDESWAWINSTHLWYFARYSGRAFSATSLSEFRGGDIIQVDKGEASGQPDGVLDHTYFVNRKDSNGFYLAAHTTNVYDKSIWDAAAQWPGANWYGTILYSQY